MEGYSRGGIRCHKGHTKSQEQERKRSLLLVEDRHKEGTVYKDRGE